MIHLQPQNLQLANKDSLFLMQHSFSDMLKFPTFKQAENYGGEVKVDPLDSLRKQLELPDECEIIVEKGEGMDLSKFKGKLHIPSSRNFEFVQYVNPKSNKWTQIFICREGACGKQLKRWHNLFDHLRTHTSERPYICPVKDCHQMSS